MQFKLLPFQPLTISTYCIFNRLQFRPIELNKVKFCLRFCLIEIVLYSFIMDVRVACTKRNCDAMMHALKDSINLKHSEPLTNSISKCNFI